MELCTAPHLAKMVILSMFVIPFDLNMLPILTAFQLLFLGLLAKRTLTHWDRLLVNGIATLSGHTPALKENIKAQVELDQLSLPDPDCSSVASSIAKARSELREVHCRLAAGAE